VEAAAARSARPATDAAAMMIMSAPVRASPMRDMRPRVTRPAAYAASPTVVGLMMIGVMMIAAMPENGAEEAAKLGERGLRLQNRGDGQSEKSE